jgi:CHASE2 domain-containing sensor protein
MFTAGGPVHGVGFGVLIGSLGLAGLRTGELPRPLALVGLASAAAGSLSLLYFVWEPAAWFIPAGRFSGLLVSGIAGVRLARRSG